MSVSTGMPASERAETTQVEPAEMAEPVGVTTAQEKPQRGLRLVHLWVIIPFAFAWLMQSTSSIEPYDFWWNVKSGQIMMQTGRFLSTDVLVWTPVREPYSNPQWGSQLIFYWLYNASPYLLLTARVLIVVGALGLIFWLCYWKSKALRPTAIATLIAYMVGWTNYGMRPQLLAFLPFLAFLFLLERKDRYPRWLPLLTPIMLLWVNVHGSFFLGVAMLGIYAVGTVLEKVGSAEGRKWLLSKQALWQALCMGAAALITLANPYVDFIYRYFFIATNDPIARALNVEWQGPTIYEGTGILFFLDLLVLLASMYMSRRRLRPTEILMVLAFGYLALTSIRNVIWWGWIVAPIMAANFSAISANLAMRRAERQASVPAPDADREELPTQRIEVPALNWLLALILVGAALLFTPLWRPDNPFVPDKEKSAVTDNTPVQLARYIEQNRPPAPLFNYMEWGGYLEWELYPTYRLFIDGRFEARTIQTWDDYLSISKGRADWQQTLDRYGVKTLILNKDWHTDLVPLVKASPSWRTTYEDKQAIVFVRR